MKIQVPNELKQAVPQTFWGRVLAATPVVMAVLATLLASLSSSEMTRAQYNRSLAAQQQSKAGDQWAYFQAKRLRGASQRNALDLLQAGADLGPLSLERLRQSAAQLPAAVASADARARELLQGLASAEPNSPQAAAKASLEQYLQGAAERQALAEKLTADALAALDANDAPAALEAMRRGAVPSLGAGPPPAPELKAATEALEELRPESEINAAVAKVDNRTIDEALRAARERTQALDAATRPLDQAIDRIEKSFAKQAELLQEARAALRAGGDAAAAAAPISRELIAGRLRYTAARYDAEARLNQAVGNLHELQVRKSNLAAERHHRRSQRFFYGMLAAQLGVIVSTFAMAAQKRNLLWSIAAGAGAVAALFGAYVYLAV